MYSMLISTVADIVAVKDFRTLNAELDGFEMLEMSRRFQAS